MAYITTEEMTAKRKALKAAFPAKAGWKLSIRKRNYSTVCVTVKEYPKSLSFPGHISVNPYGPFSPDAPIYKEKGFEFGEAEVEAINKLIAVAKGNDWYDNSDVMTDYFDTAFYISLSIGDWDAPAVPSTK